MSEQMTKEELLAKAKKPASDAMQMHPYYKGKIAVTSKCVVRGVDDFAVWYTPGVAAPCKDIQENPEMVFEHTNKGNMVAVISDGTRVLGLGDIGAEASIPVMEGKALLFKYLGGVDAFPICLDTKDPDEFIKTAKMLQPCFGGFNLEDISQPKCFGILDTLRKECHIPVWHDDQQGTAAVTLAGVINALKVVGKKRDEVKVTMIGCGAAGLATFRVMLAYGFDPKNFVLLDIDGIVCKDRSGFDEQFATMADLVRQTNPQMKTGSIPEAMEGADILIAYSKPGPDTIKKEWIQTMNKDAILFTCANPIPEIWPWEAKEAGAKIVATGRSDFPNQVNNSLGFPAIFRGTLDVRAKTITDEMCLAAAAALAEYAENNKGISEDYLIPTMDEWEVFPYEAAAVGMKAIEQGIAQLVYTREELLAMATKRIRHAREEIELLMKEGLIPPAPEGL